MRRVFGSSANGTYERRGQPFNYTRSCNRVFHFKKPFICRADYRCGYCGACVGHFYRIFAKNSACKKRCCNRTGVSRDVQRRRAACESLCGQYSHRHGCGTARRNRACSARQNRFVRRKHSAQYVYHVNHPFYECPAFRSLF